MLKKKRQGVAQKGSQLGNYHWELGLPMPNLENKLNKLVMTMNCKPKNICKSKII